MFLERPLKQKTRVGGGGGESSRQVEVPHIQEIPLARALSEKFIVETKQELGKENFWKRSKGEFEALYTAK
jgi:hypothetical protein